MLIAGHSAAFDSGGTLLRTIRLELGEGKGGEVHRSERHEFARSERHLFTRSDRRHANKDLS